MQLTNQAILLLSSLVFSIPIEKQILGFGPDLISQRLQGPFPALLSKQDTAQTDFDDLKSAAIQYVSLNISCNFNHFLRLVESELGVQTTITSSYQELDSGVAHIYLEQNIKGTCASEGRGCEIVCVISYISLL